MDAACMLESSAHETARTNSIVRTILGYVGYLIVHEI